MRVDVNPDDTAPVGVLPDVKLYLKRVPDYAVQLHFSAVTIGINASRDQAYAVCKALRWFTMAESLGGIESLICHPATMTHAAVSAEMKAKLGIDDGLVRFSVGCEDLADLQADLDQALELLA